MIDKIFDLINEEEKRQENEICLIASENYTSLDVMNACGSKLTNKYAEGYPNRRYYRGCKNVDAIETIAIEQAKKLFNCNFANVQPHSGSQANQSVYLALLTPGDTILGMDLDAGGHLTHGSKVSASGKLYNAVSYGLDENGYLNYDEIKEKLYHYHPSLLVVGASAYPRVIDFERIRQIVDEYNEFIEDNENLAGWEKEKKACGLISKCYLMVDMAHIAGLVATGLHPSPLPYADVVTSTTHKTLRGPRGGIVLTNDETIAKKIDKAVFPGIQGGPLEHIIAGKAICFTEALEPSFKEYQKQVLANIKAMEEVFNDREVNMISNGSDNHLILLDLRSKKISGKQLEEALEEIGIIVNRNAIKNDPRPKSETSGIRIGTAAITTRGATEKECKFIAHQICHMIDILTGEYDYDCVELHKDIFEQQLEKELTFKEVVLEIMKENTEHFCLEHPIYK